MIQRSSLERRRDFAFIRRKVLSAHPPYLWFTRRLANWRGHFFKLLRHSDRGDKLSWVGRGRRNLPSPFFCVFYLASPFRDTLHSCFALMTSQISCPCCLTQTLNKTRIRSLYGKVKTMGVITWDRDELRRVRICNFCSRLHETGTKRFFYYMRPVQTQKQEILIATMYAN